MELQLSKRDDMPSLLKQLNLTGDGVEVGVKFGVFSRKLLAGSTLRRLYSIDPWISFPKGQYRDLANLPQLIQDLYYLITVVRLVRFKTRSAILRMKSEDAARLFGNESLDFIFIDANHSYQGSKIDLGLWWPKLKKGGLFAGHDYLNQNSIRCDFGVKQAVDEFVKKRKLKLYVIKETWPTWYLIKE